MRILHVSPSKMKNNIEILETPVIIGNAREETFSNATFIKSLFSYPIRKCILQTEKRRNIAVAVLKARKNKTR